MLHDEVLVGVLSLYSVRAEAFTENHRRVAEIHCTANSVNPETRDSVADIAARSHLRPLSASPRSVQDLAVTAYGGHLSIAVIELAGSRRSDFRERDVASVAEAVKSGLRAADVLVRSEDDEFVALLGELLQTRQHRLFGESRSACRSSNEDWSERLSDLEPHRLREME